jgi:hypothetical protein
MSGRDKSAAYAGDIAETILHFLVSAPEAKLTEPFIKFVILGLGFLFLGKQEAVEATIEVARTLKECVCKLATVVLDTCAYAGSGNVLKVQEMLAMCGEHVDAEEGAEWKVCLSQVNISCPMFTVSALKARDHLAKGESIQDYARVRFARQRRESVCQLDRFSHTKALHVVWNAAASTPESYWSNKSGNYARL